MQLSTETNKIAIKTYIFRAESAVLRAFPNGGPRSESKLRVLSGPTPNLINLQKWIIFIQRFFWWQTSSCREAGSVLKRLPLTSVNMVLASLSWVSQIFCLPCAVSAVNLEQSRRFRGDSMACSKTKKFLLKTAVLKRKWTDEFPELILLAWELMLYCHKHMC